jgi:FAD-dependent urate hydroxylase
VTDVRSAVIIGGGIAGLVTGIALRRAGIGATVYEAHEGPAHGVGKLLLMAPNGITALRAVGADGHVAEAGAPIRQTVVENNTGRRLGAFEDLPGVPCSRMFNRADLYRALLDVAIDRGVRINYGSRLVDLDNRPDVVTARFADGTTADADVLVGADGIRSTVRGVLDPAAPAPRYVGLIGFGSPVRCDGFASTDGAFHYALGSRCIFAYSVDDTGNAGWFTGLPSAEPLSYEQVNAVAPAEWLRRIRNSFAEDRIPAVEMLSRVRDEDLVSIGRLDEMPPVPTWHRGRAVIVGDAAHAVSPSSGQGGSLAIESAVQLVRCLRDLSTIEDAFVAYEALRRDRVAKVIAGTAIFNAPPKTSGLLARVAMGVLMPIAIRSTRLREKSIGWVHRYTINWDERVRPMSVAA